MSRRFLVLLIAGALVVLAGAGALLGLRWTGRHRLAEARARFETRFGPIDAPRASFDGALPAVELTADDRTRIFELAGSPEPDWTPGDLERVRELMTHAPAAAGGARVETEGSVSAERMPSDFLVAQIWAARYRSVVARMNPRGEPDDVVDAVAALGALARSLRTGARLSDFAVSIYVEALQLAAVRDRVRDPGARPDHLRHLRAALLDDDPPEAWRRTYALDVARGAAATADELRALRTAPIWERAWHGCTADLALADLLHGTVDMADALALPYREVRGAIAAQARRSSIWAGSMGSVAIPSLIEVSRRVAAVDTLRREARVALELRLQAVRDGSYPDGLDGIPGADSDSRLTGGPLRYARGDDGSASLDVPGGAEVLGAWPTSFHGLLPDLFTWELPAATARLSATPSS